MRAPVSGICGPSVASLSGSVGEEFNRAATVVIVERSRAEPARARMAASCSSSDPLACDLTRRHRWARPRPRRLALGAPARDTVGAERRRPIAYGRMPPASSVESGCIRQVTMPTRRADQGETHRAPGSMSKPRPRRPTGGGFWRGCALLGRDRACRNLLQARNLARARTHPCVAHPEFRRPCTVPG
jgi:hypothetical protein